MSLPRLARPPREPASFSTRSEFEFLADAFSPTHETRRIDRRFSLEPAIAGEVRAVSGLNPGVDCRLAGAVVNVLQIPQSGHEPRRQGGVPHVAREVRAERAFDLLRVDPRGQPHQRVPAIDLLNHGLPEQRPGLRHRRFRTHRDLAEFPGNRGRLSRNPANLDSPDWLETRATAGPRGLFRTDQLLRHPLFF